MAWSTNAVLGSALLIFATCSADAADVTRVLNLGGGCLADPNGKSPEVEIDPQRQMNKRCKWAFIESGDQLVLKNLETGKFLDVDGGNAVMSDKDTGSGVHWVKVKKEKGFALKNAATDDFLVADKSGNVKMRAKTENEFDLWKLEKLDR